MIRVMARGCVLVLSLLAVSSLAASCAVAATPLTKTQYEQRMQDIGQAYRNDVSKVIKNAGSDNVARMALQDKQVVAVYQHLVARLDLVDPPRAVAVDHRALLTAFRTDLKWFTAAARASARGDGPQSFALSLRAVTAPLVIRGVAAERDMKAKGYKLGAFTQ
jgi:hypothetical protein